MGSPSGTRTAMMNLLKCINLVLYLIWWFPVPSKAFDRELYEGLAGKLVCHLDEARATARVELSDQIDKASRWLIFFDKSGLAFRSEQARCDYRDSDYICRWGSNHILKIMTSKIEVTFANRMAPRKVLRGWIDSDVFRPGTSLSCPLRRSLEGVTTKM